MPDDPDKPVTNCPADPLSRAVLQGSVAYDQARNSTANLAADVARTIANSQAEAMAFVGAIGRAIEDFDKSHGRAVTRLLGFVQATGGGGEAMAGAGLIGLGGAATATGGGAPPGLAAMIAGYALLAKGGDDMLTGAETAATGQYQNTRIARIVGNVAKLSGADDKTSGKVAANVNTFQGLAGTGLAAVQVARKLAAGIAKRAAGAALKNTPKTPLGARGPFSKREFDPEKAGGPIEYKSLDDVKITRAGLDQVEAHTQRFGYDAHNDAMIARQKAILDGHIEATTEDKAFYAHELEESQRYEKLGFKTGLPDDPHAQNELWNNTHSAALETYRMSEIVKDPVTGQIRSTLYHPSADPRMLPEGWKPPSGWPFSKSE